PNANPWLRGGLALLIGLFATGGNSFYHWLPAIQGRPNQGFYTSLVSTPGALLVAAAGVLSLARSLIGRPT
ncbi:MAG: hypothetical protein M3Z98_10830, partial [Candidatus Dormibacteraeota bacterium]|nr:hypothetical protein [Candidatus Dormibacteraeota bacterium]